MKSNLEWGYFKERYTQKQMLEVNFVITILCLKGSKENLWKFWALRTTFAKGRCQKQQEEGYPFLKPP